jgi:hypothetical protein
MKLRGWSSFLLFAFTLLVNGCRTETGDYSNPDLAAENNAASTYQTGKYSLPDTQTLFILGQDYDTIMDYIEAIPSLNPAGLTSYSEALDCVANNGGGTIFLDD